MYRESDFIQIALKAYDNHLCATIEEFHEDVNKFYSLNRNIAKSDSSEESTIRTLNHIISIKNVFLFPHCVYMMFYRVSKKDWGKLKTFLVYLNSMPDEIIDLNLKSSEIPVCQTIADTLRKL